MFQHQLGNCFSRWCINHHHLHDSSSDVELWLEREIAGAKIAHWVNAGKYQLSYFLSRQIHCIFTAHFSRSIKCIDLFLLFALLQPFKCIHWWCCMKKMNVHKAVEQTTALRIQGRMKNGPSLISNAFQPLNQWGIKEEKLHFAKMFLCR